MTAPTQPAATFLGRVIEEFNLNTQDPFTRLLAACFAFQDERDSLRNVVSLAVEQNAALGAEVATLKRVVAAADAMRWFLIVTAEAKIDAWRSQESTRRAERDALQAENAALRADAERWEYIDEALQADLDACRSALRAASRAAEVTPPAAAPPAPAADRLP